MANLLNVERFRDKKFFFRIQKWGWRLIGFWPGSDNVSTVQLTVAVLNIFEVLIYGVFQLTFCYVNRENLVTLLDALTPVLTQITTAFKVVVIVWNRREIKGILDYLFESFKVERTRESAKIHGRLSRVSCLIALTLLIFANLTNLFFWTLPAAKNTYRLLMGLERSYDLPFKAIFPFDIYWSPFFEFIFVTSIWSGYVTCSSIYGGDGLFLGICAHLSSEFDIIGSRISTLIEQEITSHESIEYFTAEQNDRLLKGLQEIVDEHNRLIELCKKMSRCLSPNVLIHYITSALITCICCLMVLLADGAAKLIFVNYIIASTTQVFIYSIGGNMLEDASAGIRYSAYNMNWYKCDSRIRKVILMIIMRAQRKTAVDVPFFDASLETFGTIIRTAGSYITLLKTFL